MKTGRDKYVFLTKAPVSRVILTMAIPTIISMLITSAYNVADTYFVGRINTQSTAAVGIAFSMMSVVQAVGFFFGHGSGNFISRSLGARCVRRAQMMATTGLVLSWMTGCVVAIIGLTFLEPIAIGLGSTPTILPYAKDYLGIVLLGAPFMTTSFTLNNQMRFQGNAMYAMFGVLSGAVLNILLDPLLIFSFDMGIHGAAMATLISQVVGFLILLRMSFRGGGVGIRLPLFTLRSIILKEIVFGGTPSLSRQGLASLSTLALNVVAGKYGDAAIAAMSIVGRFCFFIFAAIIGFGQGFQPLCGFCYGAGLYRRVREGFFFCVRYGTIFLSVVAAVGFAFAPEIVGEFRNDATVIDIGTRALRWQFLTFPLLPLIGLSNMYLQTIRKPLRANLVAAARSGLFFIPLIGILSSLWGLAGLEVCQSVSDVCTFALALPITLHTLNGMKAGK